jgi:hypothetical protein
LNGELIAKGVTMRSALKAATIWGAAGFVVAILFLLVSHFTDVLASVELILWPGSFAFMALDNPTATRLGWTEGAAFLVFTNIVLYFVVGLVLTAAWRVLKRVMAKSSPANRSSKSTI